MHLRVKTILDICFMLVSYVDWRKIPRTSAHIKFKVIFAGSKSLSKVMSYSVAGSQ